MVTSRSLCLLCGHLLLLSYSEGKEEVKMGSKEERNKCSKWQQMGCVLDVAEKACEPDEGGVAELASQSAQESVWLCCCPEPYKPCQKSEMAPECVAAMKEHIKPHA